MKQKVPQLKTSFSHIAFIYDAQTAGFSHSPLTTIFPVQPDIYFQENEAWFPWPRSGLILIARVQPGLNDLGKPRNPERGWMC